MKTEMTDSEVKTFEQNWRERWNPQLSDGSFAEAPASSPHLAPTSTYCHICNVDVCQCTEMIESQTNMEDIFQTEEPSTTSPTEFERPNSKEYEASIASEFKKTFVTDQELAVDGVLLRDRRELSDLDTEGSSQLVHTRWIDSQRYRVTSMLSNGNEVDRQVDTLMTDE